MKRAIRLCLILFSIPHLGLDPKVEKADYCLAPETNLALQAPVHPWDARTIFEFVFKPDAKSPRKKDRNTNAVLNYLAAVRPATSDEHRALSAPFEFFLEKEARGYFFATAFSQLLNNSPTPEDFERLFQVMLAHEAFLRRSPWWNNVFRDARQRRALLLFLLNPPREQEQRIDGSFVQRNAERLRRTRIASETQESSSEADFIEEFIEQARQWDRRKFTELSGTMRSVPDDRYCVLLRIGNSRAPEQEALIVFRNDFQNDIVYRVAGLPGSRTMSNQVVIEAKNRRTQSTARFSIELMRLLYEEKATYSLRFGFMDSNRHWISEDLDIHTNGEMEFRGRPYLLTGESIALGPKRIILSLDGIARELFPSSRTFRYFSGAFDNPIPCDFSL